MYLNYTSFFVDPYNLSPLSFHLFKQEGQEVIDGIFLNNAEGIVYPVIAGVPVFIKNRVLKSFFEKYEATITSLTGESVIRSQIIEKFERFSFSDEWSVAHEDKVDTIWGQSIEDRLHVHYHDLAYSAEELKGKLHLDVGCGNGILCKAIAEKGGTVFGIDYSTSVWNARSAMNHSSVCYLQADLHNLPFKENFFEVVYSNGVLHHTSSTENAFRKVAMKVKMQGKFYIWLYSRSNRFAFNMFLYTTDAMRFAVNKFPFTLQKAVVEALLTMKIAYNKLRGTQINVTASRTDLYDTLTPQYKFYHNYKETVKWYVKYGFTEPEQTHTNIFGFGVLGIKIKNQ